MGYIGTRLDNRYEITEQIGTGGMADVYKAHDLVEDRIVAVKILKDEFSENAEFLRRFRNESKAIAVLSHPNIVKIYDVGLDDEVKFIVMEYIDGITLKDFIEQQGVLRWKDALFFITQILRALQHAHDKGIVHRDIKPQNIMLFEDGTIKVMDFGIARFSRVDGKTLSDKTVGSVHYISPEQARGDMTDERSDIYSVGIMLYEMLTGKKPFDADSPVAIALKHMQEDCVAPREITPSIPEALEEIVLHAMEKDPAMRYQSAAQMIKDIDTFKLDPTVVFGYSGNAPLPVMPEAGFYDNTPEPPADNYYRQRRSDPADDEDEEYDDYDDEEYDDTRRSYVVPIMLAVTVAVVIMASLVIAYYAIKNFGTDATHTGNIEIPNFVGMNIVQVEQEYGDKLVFEKEDEYNNEYDEGVIMWQSQTGKTVKEGYTLQVTVSKGQKLITVPDMVNKDAEIARSELVSAGFTPIMVETWTDEIAKGMVVKTEPAAGEQYPEKKEVRVFVSQGPVETEIKVPDLKGLTKEKAIATLKENKLGCEYQDMKWDGDKGKVVEQSVDPGKYVERGTVITVYISTGETDPIDMTIKMDMPQGMRGSYTFDVYREGNLAYTKNVPNGEAIAGGTLSFDVSGKKTETLTVYVRNNDERYKEYYIRYATFNIDYDKQTAELDGSYDTENLLKITPPAETTPTPTEVVPPATDDSSQTEPQVPEDPSSTDQPADNSEAAY